MIGKLSRPVLRGGRHGDVTSLTRQRRIRQQGSKRYPACLIRYADDFVILHHDISVVQRCQQIIAEWLNGIGLELKPSKTRLTHTLESYGEENPGFDFLGFTVRHFPVGKYQSGKNTVGELLGFKTIITPSKKKVSLQSEKLRSIVRSHKAAPQQGLIHRLNPVIRGWANYYSSVVSSETFSDLDNLIYHKIRAWSNRRHPNKNRKWIANKYFLLNQGEGWVFAFRDKERVMRIAKHSETPIIRHIKVQGERSPFDGDWIYWSSRMGKHPEAGAGIAKLLKQQKGKCTHCEMYFKDGDVLETDHKIPKSQGGKDSYKNLQLLHRHCHDTKTAGDIKTAVRQQELEECLYEHSF